MTVSGPEGLSDAVNAYLLAQLPAKLNALDTEYNDGITLDDIVDFFVGEKTLMDVQSYPSIFTLVPEWNINSFKSTDIDATYSAVIGIMVMEQDTEVLRRKLYRYIRAIIELLIAAQANTLIWAVGQGNFRANFSPIYTADEVFMSDAQITTTFRRRQVEML